MAMYAALRTGDTSVLPQVKDLLSQAQERTEPESAIAYELRNVKDSKAVPDLIAVINSSRIEFTRSYVLSALAENIQDPRAVPTFAVASARVEILRRERTGAQHDDTFLLGTVH